MGFERPTEKSRRRKRLYDEAVKRMTLAEAKNHRTRWTQHEISMALNMKMKAKHVALMLGRSVKGVQKIRYKLKSP